MTNYGQAIGSIIGTAMVINLVGNPLYKAQKKLLKKIQSKGGKKKR